MGSCYSNHLAAQQGQSKKHTTLLNPRVIASAKPHKTSSALKEKLLNSPKNLRRKLRRRNNRQQTATGRIDKPLEQSIENPLNITRNNLRFKNIYADLPLINLSQASEIEEYDNSSLTDYQASESIVFTDSNVFYPFPVLNTESDFECKIFNRIDKNIMITSSLQCNYNTNLKSYNLNSPMNSPSSSSNQHGTASDVSSVFSNSESSSIQNTLMPNQKQSRLQQPQMNLNRFGFKPATAPISSNSIPLQTSKQVKNQTSPLSDSIPPKKSLTKLYIDETTKQEANKNLPDRVKRSESPVRPMLKPPSSVPMKTASAKKKTESPKEMKNSDNKRSNMKESSSISSISSTTSSNLSSTNKSKSKSNPVKIIKSVLPNSKTATTNKNSDIIPPTAKTKIASPKPQFQSNLIKPPSIAINNSNNQHKRRLFNPYMPNPSVSSNVNNKNLNTNELNNNTKENTLNFAETSVKKLDENPMENNVTNNQNEKKSHKFKLYHSISSTSKTQINVLKNLKISKMPVKSYSLASKIAAPTANKKTSIQPEQEEAVNLESLSQNSERKQCQETLALNENLIKREDSAYCSSTSSTVSSQEVEINKFLPNNLIQSKSNSQLSDHEEPTNEGSNCTELEKPQKSVLSKIDSIKIDDLILSKKTELDSKDISTETSNDDHLIEQEKPYETETDLGTENNEDQASELISKNNNQHKPIGKKNSIKESIGELNQLMSTSSIGASFADDANQKTNNIRQRRTSSTSLTHVSGSSSNGESLPMFRPRSNLPPVENSEVIELDIDEYRLLLQDLQNTKTMLYKLYNLLREPSSNSFNNSVNGENFDMQPDENQMTNSFLGNFNNAILNDKFDQSTQTD